MAFTVTSDSFKEGATLGMEHILSAEYGFGCGGGNKSPHLRWSGAPDLPTVAEAGYPGFDAFAWIAFFAPAGTPRAIVEHLNTVINRAQQLPDIRERFAEQGMVPGSGTPDEFAAFLKSNFELWDKLIKAQRIEID